MLMFWLTYFQANSLRRVNLPDNPHISLGETLRRPLVTSLRRFQAEKACDNSYLCKAAEATAGESYATAMQMFAEEEKEHARLLAEVLQSLEAPPLRHHWANTAFHLLRHIADLKAELVVLLTAEIIAKHYCRALYEGTSDRVLRAAFAQIMHDELGHIAFHADYLRQQVEGIPAPGRAAARAAWLVFFRAACLAIIWDHRDALRAVGMQPSQFWRDCNQSFAEVAGRIFERVQALDEPWWRGASS